MAKHKVNSDKVHKGVGIDGTKGENFTRQYNSDPWNPPVLTDGEEGLGAADKRAKYSGNEDAGLRRVKTDSGSGAYPSVDIWDLADAQSGKTGPVRLRKRDQE